MTDKSEVNLARTAPPSERSDRRYSHITIGLRCYVDKKWESVRAHDWNNLGFNIYLEHDLQQPTLLFKHGIDLVEGIIVWRAISTNDELIRTMVLNELLYKHSSAMAQGELHARFVKLVREPGLVSEKQAILKSLGVPLDEKTLSELVARRRVEQPMYRYGLQITSDLWNAIVKQALDISSVALSLERISNALTPER
jgi:hypothetical protein